jgi:hypothetical protein
MNCLNSLKRTKNKIKSLIQQSHLMFRKHTCSHICTQNPITLEIANNGPFFNILINPMKSSQMYQTLLHI